MISEDKIRQAAERYEEMLLAELPDEIECEIVFSTEFEKKMDRLCRKSKRSKGMRILKSAACFALVFSLCFGTVLLLPEQVQASVAGWFKEQQGNFIRLFSAGTEEELEIREYELGYLPEGCTFLDSFEQPDGKTTLYVDANGNFLKFIYTYDTGSSELNIGLGEHIHVNAVVSGEPADLYLSVDPEKTSVILWSSDDGSVLFYISALGDRDFLLKLAENVVLKK